MGEVPNYYPEEQSEENGLSSQESFKTPEKDPQAPPFDVLIVFGQGPVQKEQCWGLPTGAKARCIAAAELFHKGQIREVVLTGGKTGGEDYPSEAELMRDYLVKKMKVPEESLILEDKSTNTIENFANVLKMIDQKPETYRNLAFLSAGFHLARVEMLADKFLTTGLKFSSDELLKMRSPHHQRWVEKTTNPNQNEHYQKTLLEENRWMGGLEKIPAYWMPQASATSPERFRQIIKALPGVQDWLAENGLNNWEELSPDDLQNKIESLPREMPPAEWASREGWEEK
ncbi:MAG: hypothetical protein COX39_03325 [Candidatus Nealsonbacteria bacterium CG23_combo_of_CG06-09_8_20_14_all_40_13]|uniref:DUF218 domain-containing protein n=1 Tax=Candidatus Nealsonbacteria bacterium CG23_combo_of_CG06-09_8_20_14_all_40_13 TaxID=1974724 RepID=A0A2G9YRP3_9BACT|nr:MAG: hypothetical protein COX39_03325 [Candidatus Nealsonbacteria bacterium CG23_combo_of_CG06-09_8_20_14_all_40_13]